MADYLSVQSKIVEKRTGMALTFNSAAAHLQKTIQSCQYELDETRGRFYKIYRDSVDLTFQRISLQHVLVRNKMAAWAIRQCTEITAQQGSPPNHPRSPDSPSQSPSSMSSDRCSHTSLNSLKYPGPSGYVSLCSPNVLTQAYTTRTRLQGIHHPTR